MRAQTLDSGHLQQLLLPGLRLAVSPDCGTSETHLNSHEPSLQVLHSSRGVISRLPIQQSKRLELFDDDLGFAHLGLFIQSFELLQTTMLSWWVEFSLLSHLGRRRNPAYEFARKNLFGVGWV